MLNKDMKKNEKYKSSFEKLLPEPQPNSEPKMIGLPSATLVQNALLVAVYINQSRSVMFLAPMVDSVIVLIVIPGVPFVK